MDTNLHELFIQLVRVGIGTSKDAKIPNEVDWVQLKALADSQGLSAVVLDGMDMLNTNPSAGSGQVWNGSKQMPKRVRLEWSGEVLQQEQVNAIQQKAAGEMALLFHENGIRTYVLKGQVIAECYPRPEHRHSVDMDCFVVNENQNDNENGVWEQGNKVIEEAGFEVKRDFYKNSTFFFPGLTVENHRFLTPFRGNKRLKSLERLLQRLINDNDNENENRFEETYLYRPPVMVSALFLIEHAYSHFLHEGLTWRMVLDWVMFCRRHREEIDWKAFEGYVDEFGFRRFYDVFNAIGVETFNENDNLGSNTNCTNNTNGVLPLTSDFLNRKQRMLEDIWAPLDLHETVTGVKGKLALAGNTWRARWKYRYFTDMNWMQALWIQVKGFLFEKEPRLD